MNEVLNWRDNILRTVASTSRRLTLVTDPDCLLLEEKLLGAIRMAGFEVMTMNDVIRFRFAYEARVRSQWDQRRSSESNLILRVVDRDLKAVPYDLLAMSRKLALSLARVFPSLSYPVVASLDRTCLDALYRAVANHPTEPLGMEATKNFALRHVFGIDLCSIYGPVELLRVLLRKHYRAQEVPIMLDEWLVQKLRETRIFDAWPLEEIVGDRTAFWVFLQERWPLFLDRVSGNKKIPSKQRGFEYEGPRNLPFDDIDVRVYIDSLFVEGMLAPVKYNLGDSAIDKWVSIGIREDRHTDRLGRICGLAQVVGNTIPESTSGHRGWLSLAYRWAELRVLRSECAAGTVPSEVDRQLDKIRAEMDSSFSSWVDRRYGGLHNQPPEPPVMVHHIPRFLSRRMTDTTGIKIALVVIDGLALDQWVVLRRCLEQQRPKFRFKEGCVFAWIPTITSVSRQALFSGSVPFYFGSTILRTESERSRWLGFWTNNGLARREVCYAKGLAAKQIESISEFVARERCRAVGLVIDTVDKMMHGMQLGTPGMYNQVRQWAEMGFMAGLLDRLFDLGYSVFLVSDHGNIECEGCGRPLEGAVADVKGERVRIYSEEVLRTRVLDGFPEAVAWPPIGLPEDVFVLLAPDRAAFVPRGERVVGHGGCTIEEVVVPMVEIERLSE